VLDHPEIVAGKRVVDLGCGSGLVGIAAAMGGAQSVIALDADPFAIAATCMNAVANGVAIIAEEHDLRSDDAPGADVVLAGDVFYDAALADDALRYLSRCAARGVYVLVGDPGRAHLPMDRLERLASYDGADFAEPQARVSVFTLV
jgi:predicted nicotinamide N-methyase